MTETAQPDPAAEWRAQKIEEGRRMIAAMSPERRADLEEMLGKDPRALGPELTEAFGLTPRPPKPLTVADTDIPAGHGASSLFLRDESDAVWFKNAHGHAVPVWSSEETEGQAALWQHLAATLPHVTEDAAP